MYKKLFVLVCVLLLAISMSVAAVNFSQSTKIAYQQKITRIINKAATYVSISASEKAWYSNYFNNALNEIEKMYKEPNIPESVKISAGKSFFDEIDYMENYLNNPTISSAQKVQEIKMTMKQISDAAAQDKQIEEQNRIAEEKWRAEQEAARKKAQAEQEKRLAEQEAARKKAQLEQAKRVAEQEAAKKKVEAERAKRLAEQEAARKQEEEIANIKKECIAKVSGLCFNWPQYPSQEFQPHSGDYWADANQRCKKSNMSLPTKEQLQIYYNYVVAQDPGSYSVGITKLWSSELAGKHSAYILQGYRDEFKFLQWPKSNEVSSTICVKPVSGNSPLSKLQDYYGLMKINRKF